MSKIDDLMKQLEEKKTVIEAYNLIADSLGKTLEDKKFDSVREDVSGKLAEFIIAQIEEVEQAATAPQSSQITNEPSVLPGFSQEDMVAMRTLLDKVKGRTPQNNGAFATGSEAPQQPRQNRPVNKAAPDKIKFALANRHLEGKTVVFEGQNGLIEGVVRGLDAPNVVVSTQTGQTIDVPIDQVEVKGA